MHSHDPTDPFFVSRTSIENVGAGLQSSAINSEKTKLADEGVGSDLESQCRKGLTVLWFSGQLGVCLRVYPPHLAFIRRTREVIAHCIKYGLDYDTAPVAPENGVKFSGLGRCTYRPQKLVLGYILAGEVFFQKRVIALHDFFEEPLAVFLGLGLHVRGNFLSDQIFVAKIFVSKGFHLYEIDKAADVFFETDR